MTTASDTRNFEGHDYSSIGGLFDTALWATMYEAFDLTHPALGGRP